MTAEWIAVDWGTSNLRVWFVDRDGVPFANVGSDQGMGSLVHDEFEPALLALIAPYLSDDRVTPVMCAGMVGARQGWVEANYLTAPCSPVDSQRIISVSTTDPRISVRILPGIQQVSPPDVMRGEETQIAGALQSRPNFDGVICLPGTHTKWVHISAGEIVSFQTLMTGEIFALLNKHSVLRHFTSGDDWDQPSFISGLNDAMAKPGSLAARLFGIRASGLISDVRAGCARARLSGLLIGSELVSVRPYWLGRDVAILGSESIVEHYRSGLSELGVDAAVWNATDLTLAGLSAAYNSLKEDLK